MVNNPRQAATGNRFINFRGGYPLWVCPVMRGRIAHQNGTQWLCRMTDGRAFPPLSRGGVSIFPLNVLKYTSAI